VVSELVCRGHEVRCYEPWQAWSLANLVEEHGWQPVREALDRYPMLDVHPYDPNEIDLDRELAGVDVVIVHEWNEPELVARIAERRRRSDQLLLFHDSHHRACTQPEEMQRYPLEDFDAALVFGEALRRVYLERGWVDRVYTWHEAADDRLFRPLPPEQIDGDLVWIGNWGDDERKEELVEFLFEPVRRLGLRARVYGVRYPEEAQRALATAGIEYGGWLPNHRAPRVFSRFRITVHVPRRPYAAALPGIPTIRVFEALACGIPLITAPWSDAERLFAPGDDFLVARDGNEMTALLERVLREPELAHGLRTRGLARVRERHTCRHRVDELLAIVAELRGGKPCAA
jgi:spore maturation protein CgeB